MIYLVPCGHLRALYAPRGCSGSVEVIPCPQEPENLLFPFPSNMQLGFCRVRGSCPHSFQMGGHLSTLCGSRAASKIKPTRMLIIKMPDSSELRGNRMPRQLSV